MRHDASIPASCNQLYGWTLDAGLKASIAASQFVAVIDPDGAGPSVPQNVWCHFETAGPLEGGWTVVAFQREDGPQGDWGAGIEPARAAASYFASSFAMSDAQIPPHAQTAFGRRFFDAQNEIEILDAVTLAYTTGDIAFVGAAALPGVLDPGKLYDVSRRSTGFYDLNDPEMDLILPGHPSYSAAWEQTLIFDVNDGDVGEVAGRISDFGWSFSPRNDASAAQRGFSYNGNFNTTVENFGWAVLVR